MGIQKVMQSLVLGLVAMFLVAGFASAEKGVKGSDTFLPPFKWNPFHKKYFFWKEPPKPEPKPPVPEYKPPVPEYKPPVPEYKPPVPEYKPPVPEYKPPKPEVPPEYKPHPFFNHPFFKKHPSFPPGKKEVKN